MTKAIGILFLLAGLGYGQTATRSRLANDDEDPEMKGVTSMYVVAEYTSQNDTKYEDLRIKSYLVRRCQEAGIRLLQQTYPKTSGLPRLTVLGRKHDTQPGNGFSYIFGVIQMGFTKLVPVGSDTDGTIVMNGARVWGTEANYIFVPGLRFDTDIQEVLTQMTNSFIAAWKRANPSR